MALVRLGGGLTGAGAGLGGVSQAFSAKPRQSALQERQQLQLLGRASCAVVKGQSFAEQVATTRPLAQCLPRMLCWR